MAKLLVFICGKCGLLCRPQEMRTKKGLCLECYHKHITKKRKKVKNLSTKKRQYSPWGNPRNPGKEKKDRESW